MEMLLKSTLLAAFLFLMIAPTALAQSSKINGLGEIEFYGNLLWMSDSADSIFVVDPIEKGDSFAFRQALREHPISTVVLASPGGSIYEALQISEVIRDRSINTYVPSEGSCESACAFLFFSGAARVSDGQLGVHQFFTSSDGDETASESGVQYTVSEIIAFLNRYNVPAWVYEDMFRSSEMYYFTNTELAELELQPMKLVERGKLESIYSTFKIISSGPSEEANGLSQPVIAPVVLPLPDVPVVVPRPEVQPVQPENVVEPSQPSSKPDTDPSIASPELTSPQNLIADIQIELRRVGCYDGKLDGILGPKSIAARKAAAAELGLSSSATEEELLTALQRADRKLCEKPTLAPPPSALTLSPRYEVVVTCGDLSRKHWLYLFSPELTGWDRTAIPNDVRYSFSIENRGKGAYGLCGGLSCIWRFSGWVSQVGAEQVRFQPNDYATEGDQRPGDFEGVYRVSPNGFSGTDKLGCSVRGTPE